MTRYNSEQVSGWLQSMQQQLQQLIQGDPNAAMIGIKSGGVDVGKHLHNSLGIKEPLGELNISFYRDDFSTIGLHPVVGASQVPFSIDGRHIILVDDVLSTGRTVRAAMNEIFDYGRPSRITLAVLVQRTGHELPIRADIIGESIDLADTLHVSLEPHDMSVTIKEQTS
jgi:pyrimidine operon attenuation protein/uracil phosphoribosyltransferase